MSAFQISDNDYPRWEHLPMEHALLDGLIETDYGQFDLLCGVTTRAGSRAVSSSATALPPSMSAGC